MAPKATRWMLAVVQVPAEPSRHRVAVWRELRRVGAVPVAQGTWALPATAAFREAAARAHELAAAGGGQVAVFEAKPQDEAAQSLLADAFAAARREEWGEYLSDCDKFVAGVDRDIAKGKFTFAELDEEEQSLDRLRRWYRDLRKRDVQALPDAETAMTRLHDCERALETYAEKVYAATRDGRLPDAR